MVRSVRLLLLKISRSTFELSLNSLYQMWMLLMWDGTWKRHQMHIPTSVNFTFVLQAELRKSRFKPHVWKCPWCSLSFLANGQELHKNTFRFISNPQFHDTTFPPPITAIKYYRRHQIHQLCDLGQVTCSCSFQCELHGPVTFQRQFPACTPTPSTKINQMILVSVKYVWPGI